MHELQTVYDVCDLFDFHESIDIEHALQEEARTESKNPKIPKPKRRR